MEFKPSVLVIGAIYACGGALGVAWERYRACAVHKWRTARTCLTRWSTPSPVAMCWKQVTKFQKSLYIILLYLIVYLVISYAMAPETKITFISDQLRVGDRYVLMFLVAPKMTVFLDAEGADVFASRKCGDCFITNNIGFLPISEYDAVLVYGKWTLLTQTSAFMDPAKRYLMESDKSCLRKKFRGCLQEPRVTSFATRDTYDLCGLCKYLLKKKV